MQMPEPVLRVLVDRFTLSPDWFKKGYEDALDRIEDRTADDPQNPYYFAPTFNGSGFKTTDDGPLINDQFSELDIETARKTAFELLALADLAEAAPEPAPSNQTENTR